MAFTASKSVAAASAGVSHCPKRTNSAEASPNGFVTEAKRSGTCVRDCWCSNIVIVSVIKHYVHPTPWAPLSMPHQLQLETLDLEDMPLAFPYDEASNR